MAWNFGGTGAQAVLQVCVVAVLARLLEPSQFGTVAAAMVVISFSTIFTQLGIGPALVQMPNAGPRHAASGFALSITIGAVFAALVWFAAPAIAAIFRMPQLAPILKLLAIFFPIQACGIVAEALMQRELRFERLAAIDILSFAFGFGAVTLTLAFQGFGARALVAGYLGQVTLKAALLLFAQGHVKSLIVDRASARDLWRFGSAFSLGRIFNFIAIYGDNALVGRMLGPAALGFYNQAYQFISMPANLFGTVIDRVLFPAMASVQDERNRVSRAFRTSVQMTFVLTAPFAAVVIVLAPEIVHALLGGKWTTVILPLQILSASLMFRTAYKMSDSLARAKFAGLPWVWRQALYALLVILGVLIGRRWGIAGVAGGVAAAIAINYVFMSHLSLKLVDLPINHFLSAHVPGLIFGAWIAVISIATATLCRASAMPGAVTIAVALTVSGSSGLLLCYRYPNVLIGSDGVRCLQILRSMMLSRWSAPPGQ